MGKDKPGKCGFTASDNKTNCGLLENVPCAWLTEDSYCLEGSLHGEKGGQGQWVSLSSTEADSQRSLQPKGQEDNTSNSCPKSSFTSASGVPIPSIDWRDSHSEEKNSQCINFLPLSASLCTDHLDTFPGGLIWLLFSSRSFLWMDYSHKSWKSGHKRQHLCWYWNQIQYKTFQH